MRCMAEAAVSMGATLTLMEGGVTLHLDSKQDALFIEIAPGEFDRAVVRRFTKVAEQCGYEVMPEWECPPEVMDGGAIRHWLAEKEVVHDCTLKAV